MKPFEQSFDKSYMTLMLYEIQCFDVTENITNIHPLSPLLMHYHNPSPKNLHSYTFFENNSSFHDMTWHLKLLTTLQIGSGNCNAPNAPCNIKKTEIQRVSSGQRCAATNHIELHTPSLIIFSCKKGSFPWLSVSTVSIRHNPHHFP